MDRLELIQTLIDNRGFKNYLEIGVLGGSVFFNVRCPHKSAVDPKFKFNWKGRLGESLKNWDNLTAGYFEVTSDEFFDRYAPRKYQAQPLDVVLVDGMHEFEFALRDVLHSLQYLSQDGVIIMHDCNPLSKEAEASFAEWQRRGYSGFWNGDVWKVIAYLLQARPDLDVFVADCDHGLGVITRNGEPTHELNIDKATFANMTYEDLASRRSELLNLKPVDYLRDLASRKKNT